MQQVWDIVALITLMIEITIFAFLFARGWKTQQNTGSTLPAQKN
jgi:hypothetical protein